MVEPAPSLTPLWERLVREPETLTLPDYERLLNAALQSGGTFDAAEDATDAALEQAVYAHLKKRLGARGQGNLGLGQINTTPGDLAGNAGKIMRYIRAAEEIGLDLIIFPELALMGYPPRDVIGRHPFLVRENLKWLKAIAERTGETYALVGFVEPRSPEPGHQRVGKKYFNSMAVLGEGEIKALVRKSLLPTYQEFEDYRQFEFSPASGAHHPETLTMAEWGFTAPVPSGNLYQVHGKMLGLSICEDLWNDSTFFDSPLYARDPIAELAAQKPHLLINISASPTRSRKEQMKHNLCGHIAQKYTTPLVYVNQVGTVDEVSFDGGSRVYDGTGRLIARAAMFEEQLLIANPFTKTGKIAPMPMGLEKTLGAQKTFNAFDTSDLGRTYECVVQGIRDYFHKTGFERAVIGLSGGLDSSVTVVLLADALGPGNVLGVGMPSALTPDDNRDDAKVLAQNLGIHWTEVPIQDVTQAFGTGLADVTGALEAAWGGVDARSNAVENIQAISRATILRQLGNMFRALPVATSDKSELYLGYATVNGDMSGALAPLGDIPKTKVRLLAHWLNENRAHKNAIPEAVIGKPSGADLKKDPVTGKLVTAESELMPYEFADEVIWRLEALGQSFEEMLAAQFQYEEAHTLSQEQKAAWVARFYDRMAKAVFKWFIAPPILIVEGNGSIAKSDYHHPIVANRVRWQGHDPAEIASHLDRQRHAGSPQPAL